MTKISVKKVQYYIFGRDENFSLEQRLLLFALVMGIFMGCLGSITNFFIATSIFAAIVPMILAIITFVLYYFVRFKNIFKPISVITVIIGILGISIVWILNGGINGPNTMVAFAILVLALVIVSNRTKIFVIIYFILLNIIIFLIQIYRPDLIEGYSSELARWIDYIICLIYSSLFIFLIIRFIHKHYTIERERAEKSELKIMQKNDELQKLNSDKDRFIQVLAHDLKNPFNSIIGFSDLLLKNLRKYNTDKIEKQLIILNQATKNTFNLLDDLLLWSKSTMGQLPFEPLAFEFVEIYSDVIKNLNHQAEAKQITINYSGSETNTIFADVNMVKTILRNLISNAIKFTKNNGLINISTQKNQEHLIIIISDNGIGIKKDIQAKLWDISQPFSTRGTSNEVGTGLGLLLCKEFVEKNKGEIWVESEPGKGSDFKFTIPLHKN